ncbi:type I restriction enzyme, S subunit [Zhouia amylolytica]|uniref:Type I restriction enzyme, S subunit n=1 Tax=Zhouia amylolytica TaxID=376730 RepID=A0A1I6T695_9FLAO|nr:restriction endonuclease subunit S [Zhouia amylolytica]SFS84663.1 type I restriction enzyme, S subunit [Zhouia amylolytica]
MTSNYRKIGDFIELVDERNKDLSINLLLGLSISKEFIPSVANTVGTNMKNYKIIRKGQFACSVMQVRRDKKMPVALLQDFDEAIISQAYPVFQIINESQLLPEYLMMWFTRSEFDREACFHAVGGVRGSLEWEDFLNMKLPVPSIEKQLEIVKEYNTVVNRIKLNEQLNQKLEETAQTLYKHWFVDFEFPNEEGKPYKSSGGVMVYNEELDMEIPVGWKLEVLSTITKDIFSGGTPSTNEETYWGNEFFWLSSGETRETVIIDSERMITKEGVKNSSTKLAKIGDSIMATAGQGKTRGQTSFCKIDSYINQSVLCIRPLEEKYQAFIFFNLYSRYHELRNESDGQSIRGSLNKGNLSDLPIIIPQADIIESFQEIGMTLLDKIHSNRQLSKQLNEIKSLLLSRMTSYKVERELAN